MIHFLNTCCICGEPIDQGVWRCSVCDRRYRTRNLLPPPSDPRRAVISDLVIDCYRQGHCVITGSMLELKCKTLEVTSPERFQVFRISGEQNR